LQEGEAEVEQHGTAVAAVQPAPAGDDDGARRRRREVRQPVRQPLRRAVRVPQPAAAGVLPATVAAGVLPTARDANNRLPAGAVRRRRLRADAVHAHALHTQAGVQPGAVRRRVGVEAVHAFRRRVRVLLLAAGDALPAGPRVPAERRRRPPCGLGRGVGGGRSPAGPVMMAIGSSCTDRRDGGKHMVIKCMSVQFRSVFIIIITLEKGVR
jgi:hypothetical protein